VDGSGNAYISGITVSADFPTVAAVQPSLGGNSDAFVTKVNPTGSALVFSTYLGGCGSEGGWFDLGSGSMLVGSAIALDSSGNTYVTGFTDSIDFSTTGAIQPGFAGGTADAFVAKLSGLALPVVGLSPVALNFGSVSVGSPSPTKAVSLGNNGDAVLDVSSIAVAGANSNDFHIENHDCGASVAVSASCTINVAFSPTAGGPRKSSVVITSDAAGSPHRAILTGIGSALSLAPSSWNFGSQTVGTTSSPKAITLTNLGSTAVHVWTTAIAGTNSGDFSRVNSCPVPPATLGGGANCTISVQFTPAGIGGRTASLMISHDGGASPAAVSLTGNGTAAASSRSRAPRGSRSRRPAPGITTRR
jgi:hypothetical protein